MTVNYGPRCRVHDDRIGAVKTQGANRLFVLHTTEGGEGPNSAEALCSFLGTPGDRQVPGSNPPRMFGASYQYLIDTDRILPAVEESVVAYSAAGANHDGVHACFPGKANQTRVQWLDPVSRAMIGQCAELMLDRMPKLGIPFNRLTVDEVVAGRSGYCDHWTISRAYGLSDHTDVGPNFPWDVLASDIAKLEEPVIKYFNLVSDKPSTLWATSDGLIAVRLEGHQVTARGDVPATIPVLTKAEADKYVYLNGLPSISVK